ncbi:hypothetical protein J6590_013433 [Homalodisca vitripennis]|nr:hypothetical protein J6590_013433 [Homalodisca vitripennis]
MPSPYFPHPSLHHHFLSYTQWLNLMKFNYRCEAAIRQFWQRESTHVKRQFAAVLPLLNTTAKTPNATKRRDAEL